MVNCIVTGCCSHSSRPTIDVRLRKFEIKKDKNISYLCFPSKGPQRDKWVQILRRYGGRSENWEPSKYAKICGLHFRAEDMYRLHKGKNNRDHLMPMFPADDILQHNEMADMQRLGSAEPVQFEVTGNVCPNNFLETFQNVPEPIFNFTITPLAMNNNAAPPISNKVVQVAGQKNFDTSDFGLNFSNNSENLEDLEKIQEIVRDLENMSEQVEMAQKSADLDDLDDILSILKGITGVQTAPPVSKKVVNFSGLHNVFEVSSEFTMNTSMNIFKEKMTEFPSAACAQKFEVSDSDKLQETILRDPVKMSQQVMPQKEEEIQYLEVTKLKETRTNPEIEDFHQFTTDSGYQCTENSQSQFYTSCESFNTCFDYNDALSWEFD